MSLRFVKYLLYATCQITTTSIAPHISTIMTVLHFYIEYHWGRRRPNLEFYVNGQQIFPRSVWCDRVSLYQENMILETTCKLLDHNQLQVVMKDKTDHDLVFEDSGMIDHWAKIQEVEIDGILSQTALYFCSNFQHSMSPAWIETMHQQGYVIESVYAGGTDIRLNGTWTMEFTTPVWEWYINNYEQTNC